MIQESKQQVKRQQPYTPNTIQAQLLSTLDHCTEFQPRMIAQARRMTRIRPPRRPLQQQPRGQRGGGAAGYSFKKLAFLPSHFSDLTPQCKWTSASQVYLARRWLPLLNGTEEKQKLRVASYNILAQSNIHFVDYSDTNKSSLEWKNCLKNLKEEIQLLDADILCLQEVDQSQAFFTIMKEQFNYEHTYVKKTGEDKKDGQGTFWKKDHFTLLQDSSLAFRVQAESHLLNKPQVCLLTVLRSNKTPKRCFVVANIHCIFNNNRGDIKLAQIMFSLKALEKLIAKYWEMGFEVSTIFCGDFNMLACSATYQLITQGKHDLFSISRNKVSGQHRGFFSQGRDLDFDFYRKQIEPFRPRKPQECRFPKIEEFLAQLQNTELVYNQKDCKFELTHIVPLTEAFYDIIPHIKDYQVSNSLPLRSAYSLYLSKLYEQERVHELGKCFYGFTFNQPHLIRQLCEESTRQQAYSHFSPNVSGSTDFIFHDSTLQPARVFEVLSPQKLMENFEGVPNRLIPSDHFAIAADFTY